jgi:hypothetical protein
MNTRAGLVRWHHAPKAMTLIVAGAFCTSAITLFGFNFPRTSVY